jgi:lysyl-tRNA synthetase class 2
MLRKLASLGNPLGRVSKSVAGPVGGIFGTFVRGLDVYGPVRTYAAVAESSLSSAAPASTAAPLKQKGAKKERAPTKFCASAPADEDVHAALTAAVCVEDINADSQAVRHTVYSNQRAADFAAHKSAFPTWSGPFAPEPVRPSMSVDEYRAKYAHLEAGARLESEPPSTLCGRVVSARHASKQLIFLDIAAHSLPMGPRLTDAPAQPPAPLSRQTVQVIVSERRSADAMALSELVRRGDWIAVTGIPGMSKTQELSIVATEVTLLSPCLQPLPPKLTNPELRARERHLDLLVNQAATWPVFRARAVAMTALRGLLISNGFVEVETPTLWTQAGGATARPFVTSSNAFGGDTSLTLRIAPELFLKQLVVGGIERVFELGKVFRNEGIDATHSPEFTSCEAYWAHADYTDMVAFTERVIRTVVGSVAGAGKTTVTVQVHAGAHADALTSPAVRVLTAEEAPQPSRLDVAAAAPPGAIFAEIDFGMPFATIDIVPALAELGAPLPTNFNDPAALPELIAVAKRAGVEFTSEAGLSNGKVIDSLIGELIEPRCVGPTLLMHHPVCLSPLAKRHNTRVRYPTSGRALSRWLASTNSLVH